MMRKVWYQQIWIQNYFGFRVLILTYILWCLRSFSPSLFPIIIHLFLHEDNTYAYSIFLASNVLLHLSRPKLIMEIHRQWRTHENKNCSQNSTFYYICILCFVYFHFQKYSSIGLFHLHSIYIAQILVQSYFEVVSLVLALEATEPIYLNR